MKRKSQNSRRGLRLELLERRYALSGEGILLQDGFETGQPSTDWNDVFSADGSDGVVSDSAASGANSYRIRYSADEDEGKLSLNLPQGDEFYVRYRQMYPQGFLQRNLKQAMLFHPEGGNYQGSLIQSLWGNIDGNTDPESVQLATTFYGGYEEGHDERITANWSNFPIRAGEWFKTAFYIKLNTPGESDGIYRLWRDDVLIVDLSNVVYRTTSESPEAFWLGGNYSGAGQDPESFDRLLDDVLIARTPDDDLPGNDLPTIGEFGFDLSYRENAAPLPISPTATISDPDSSDFDGGLLTVQLESGGRAEDRLAVRNSGALRVSAGQLSWNGQAFATVSGGVGQTPLVVQFNDSSTVARAQFVLRQVVYRNASNDPHTNQRTITAQIADGDGGASAVVSKRLTVVAVNDAPVLSGLGTTTYQEDAAAILIAANANVADPDSKNFGGGILKATVTANENVNDRLTIRSGTPAPGVISVSGTTVRLNTTTIGTITISGFGTKSLQISLNSNATVYAVRQLLRAITFRTVGDTPSVAQRTVQFLATDGDGGRSEVARGFIKVVEVNDPPQLGLSGSINYTRNAAAILLAAAATVSDVDSSHFSGGRLHVRITTGDSSANRLSIGGVFTIVNDNVMLGSVSIGKRTSNGFGTNDLIVVFNSNATVSRVQQLVRAVNFKTVAGSAGTRSVLFSVSDGEGGISPVRTKTVNVS